VNRAVRRLLDQRETEGLGRHVEDEHVLGQVAHLLDANDGAGPESDAAATATRSTTTQPGQERKVRRA
jgi:predicted ATPase